MVEKANEIEKKNNRRTLGVHLTSIDIFQNFIYPEIKNNLREYLWIDLYCGEGNLILPILDVIPKKERTTFFKNHIFLSDIQEEMVQKCIENANYYSIPYDIAKKNIKCCDNLESFPDILKNKDLPICHITNPPYLYLGYIRKHQETKRHFKYFERENEGYQDLYQIAMINDLRNKIKNLIYIIPSNFIFGSAVSNKFRNDFLKYYNIIKIYIFETKIFKFTGTNIAIIFLKYKNLPKSEVQKFTGIKIIKSSKRIERIYKLDPKFNYRGGSEFDEFTKNYRCDKPLIVNYYLLREEIEKNKGDYEIEVIDTNNYNSNEYEKLKIHINNRLKKKILSNILFVRTVDTGSNNGRVGLYEIRKYYDVDGIYVSKNTYRTSPIQIFLFPQLSIKDQLLLLKYFNFILEYFRTKLDSEFMTTYKYSDANYTRKYLGLTQVRKLIETFPLNKLALETRYLFENLINIRNFNEILKFLKAINNKSIIKSKKQISIINWK